MKIVDIAEVTAPIASSIANAYIDFSKMTLSLGDDDRAILPLPGAVRLAVRVEEPT